MVVVGGAGGGMQRLAVGFDSLQQNTAVFSKVGGEVRQFSECILKDFSPLVEKEEKNTAATSPKAESHLCFPFSILVRYSNNRIKMMFKFFLKKKRKRKKYTYLMCINQSAFQKLKRPYFSFLYLFIFLRFFSFQNLPESKGVFLLSLSPSTRSSQHRNEKQVVCV